MNATNSAVLVGIDKYWSPGWPTLTFAESDCEKLLGPLDRYTFPRENIRLLTGSARDQGNFPTRNILLHDALREPKRFPDLNIFLFYFAGHGLAYLGQSYLIPADGARDEPGSWIALADILEAVSGVNAQLRLIVFDICHSGAVRGVSGMQTLPSTFAEELSRVHDALVFSACSVDEESHEDVSLGGGVFSHYFSKALSETPPRPNGIISAFDVYRSAKEAVGDWAHARGLRQSPCFWGQGQSDDMRLDRLIGKVDRTHMVVLKLRELLEPPILHGIDPYVIRIRARLSSLAVSDEETWQEHELTYRNLLLEERAALDKVFAQGAQLRVMLSWNMEDFFNLSDTRARQNPLRLKELRAYCQNLLENHPDRVSRATFVRVPVPERNYLFLNNEFLFVGRKLEVSGGFDHTELFRRSDTIAREVKMFERLFRDGIRFCFGERGIPENEIPWDEDEALNRWLLEYLIDRLDADIAQCEQAAS